MSDSLFEQVANEIADRGYCVLDNALPKHLAQALEELARQSSDTPFESAGVGRGSEHLTDKNVRSDSIRWIDGNNEIEKSWLDYLEELKTYLNRRLFLGLFSYESHFAHYAPGAFYEKHLDAFRGQSNRVLSLVTYLNDDWESDLGGELLLYDQEGEQVMERVLPKRATLVIFLSEEFPHEVLPATKDRYSIASWFRVNTSGSHKADPP